MTTADVLRAARAKIEQPKAWTKGRLAKNSATGISVHPKSPKADCWCSEGAITAVAPDITTHIAALAVLGAALEQGRGLWDISVWGWNDNAFRTHAEVLAGFDAAIEKAEADEK